MLVYNNFHAPLALLDKLAPPPERQYARTFDLEELYDLVEGYADYTDNASLAELSVKDNGWATLIILDKTEGTTVQVYNAELTDELFKQMDVCYSHAVEESSYDTDDFRDKWEAMIQAMSPIQAEAEFGGFLHDPELIFGDFSSHEISSKYPMY